MQADSTWDQTNKTDPTPERKRQRTLSKQLGDSVVLSTIGQGDHSEIPIQSLKRALLNIIDTAIAEIENRFSKRNLDLMKAVDCLLSQSRSFSGFDRSEL